MEALTLFAVKLWLALCKPSVVAVAPSISRKLLALSEHKKRITMSRLLKHRIRRVLELPRSQGTMVLRLLQLDRVIL